VPLSEEGPELTQGLVDTRAGQGADPLGPMGAPIEGYGLVGQDRAADRKARRESHFERVSPDACRDGAEEGQADAGIVGLGR